MNPQSLSSSLAVVVPCYNAGGRLLPVLEALAAVAPRLVLVDDGSTDGCTSAIDALATETVRFAHNRGKGHALLAGFEAALSHPDVQVIACLDADGQHDPAELPGLVAAREAQEADLLIGSRSFTGGGVPFRSRFGNVMTVGVMSLLTGHRLPDTQSGYRLLSRRLATRAVAQLKGGRYETEMEILLLALSEGFSVKTSPIRTIYETGNPSSHFRKISDSWRIYRAMWQRTRR